MLKEPAQCKVILVSEEQGPVVQKIVLHACAHDQRRKKGQRKKKKMYPITWLGRRKYELELRRLVLWINVKLRHICAGAIRAERSQIFCGIHSRGYTVCISLPGLKRTALPGGISTCAPVFGLRPMPVLRGRTVNTPKPRSSMRSPRDRACFILSKTASTAR